MTIKIELLDSVIEAFRNSDRELFEEISDEEIRYGITAALEAMVKCGMAYKGKADFSVGQSSTSEDWKPSLIIRLDGGKS